MALVSQILKSISKIVLPTGTLIFKILKETLSTQVFPHSSEEFSDTVLCECAEIPLFELSAVE